MSPAKFSGGQSYLMSKCVNNYSHSHRANVCTCLLKYHTHGIRATTQVRGEQSNVHNTSQH